MKVMEILKYAILVKIILNSDKFYRFYSINDDYFGKGNSRNIKIGNNIKKIQR